MAASLLNINLRVQIRLKLRSSDHPDNSEKYVYSYVCARAISLPMSDGALFLKGDLVSCFIQWKHSVGLPGCDSPVWVLIEGTAQA